MIIIASLTQLCTQDAHDNASERAWHGGSTEPSLYWGRPTALGSRTVPSGSSQDEDVNQPREKFSLETQA